MFKGFIKKLIDGVDLSEGEMIEAMAMIMGGEATHAQMAAFLTALRLKGETVPEITGAAKVMRERATRIGVASKAPLVDIDRDEINVEYESILDTCGTGGSGTNTFNISTTTAFILAAGGVIVAKHGNRSVSSLCGSADVLEALGVNLDVTKETVERCLGEIGIGFLYAPLLHSAMKHVAPVRREIGVRTVFNILGPLSNPAGAQYQVLGVYQRELTRVMAEVLGNLGSKRAMVVHGCDGMDEITITGPTFVAELSGGEVNEYEITPEEFGISRVAIEEIKGGDAEVNAGIVRSVLAGEAGPKRDVVLLNAGAAFYLTGKAESLEAGIKLAAQVIDSGAAGDKLAALVEMTNE
ncbi:MAG: anthranilate phosphoribosyltransferase [Deltaproteobacteria bacterium]|nr:MAG: anthranilate phosphoribosyltransferase [Deltaproteobacteria bacterium]